MADFLKSSSLPKTGALQQPCQPSQLANACLDMASRKEQIMNQIKTELALVQAQELINVSDSFFSFSHSTVGLACLLPENE